MSHSTILITGGAGYIGSHTCVALIEAGYSVVIYDNFSNSSPAVIARLEQLTEQTITFVQGDVRDQCLLEQTIRTYQCKAVIHFAGLKAVGESVTKPLYYYEHNVSGTITLLRAMQSCQIYTLIFSSSATVYGEPQYLPLNENHSLSVTNPYGRSKLMVEDILRDLNRAEPQWKTGILRYFNPVGAHKSGQIGEDPQGIPNNLMPFVAQVAAGRRPQVQVWGNDYSTPDGTGVRDYIHVLDLAEGHVKAVQYLEQNPSITVNLGTGKGYSVLEVIEAFGQAVGSPIPYTIAARRPGDVASCYADAEVAQQALGWVAKYDLQDMCADHWYWQRLNPTGYIT